MHRILQNHVVADKITKRTIEILIDLMRCYSNGVATVNYFRVVIEM